MKYPISMTSPLRRLLSQSRMMEETIQEVNKALVHTRNAKEVITERKDGCLELGFITEMLLWAVPRQLHQVKCSPVFFSVWSESISASCYQKQVSTSQLFQLMKMLVTCSGPIKRTCYRCILNCGGWVLKSTLKIKFSVLMKQDWMLKCYHKSLCN